MVSICFYFQVHQPYRLRKYHAFDVGSDATYFDDKKNREILHKVAHKCYLPANALMLELLERYPQFKIAYSFSGVFLQQCEEYYPEVINSFKKLVDTGRVEVLSETYYHSLAFLYSKEEFKAQVQMHKDMVKRLFGVEPKVFRNTELLYNNEIAKYVEGMGYKGIIAEGADHILGWRSPNFVYQPTTTKKIKLLLKNYKLSDDIAFRFSSKEWTEWPLSSEKFAHWVNAVNGNGDTVNLFMDYETIGEHQWEDTGIFHFLRQLPYEILRHPDNTFKTPSEVVDTYPTRGELDVHNLISWADIERDASAWLGNTMQQMSIGQLYALEQQVKKTQDESLLARWRLLTTSDHFYYMCTKWFSDGDVHKYFNPYDRPHDSFVAFMNILNDIKLQLKERSPEILSPLKNEGARDNGVQIPTVPSPATNALSTKSI